MSEEFALEKLFRNRGAIHANERLVFARTATMDFARDQFLAGAGFALNQHGSIRRRDKIDLADDLAQRSALTNQIAERARLEHLLLKICVVLFELVFSDAGSLQTHAR